MFLGTYKPNLIGERRIALPKKIRDELTGNKVVLTIGFEECIYGFNLAAWNEITRTELVRPLFSDLEGRDLRRKICAGAVNIELDNQGRFIIPSEMMDYAGISEDIIVIGAGDHFELWEKNIWVEYRKKIDNK